MARTKDTVSLLIGAGIGVGLMYLLDPEAGAARRSKLNKRAVSKLSGLSSHAKDWATEGLDHLHDLTDKLPGSLGEVGSVLSPIVAPAVAAAKDVYSHLGRHASDATGSANDAVDHLKAGGKDAASTAKAHLADLRSQLVSKLSDRIDDLAGPQKAKYKKLLNDASLALGRDEDHHYVGQTTCALGSLALGAGLIYFLDPDKGHERRDKMASGVSSTVQEIGSFFRHIGARIVRRGQAVVDQASDHLDDLQQKAVEIRDNYLSGSGTPENADTNAAT